MTDSTAQILERAITCHQAGQLQEAGELYLSILQAAPHHPEANHNLGRLAVQAGQHAAALSYLMAALETDPACGRYWVSYIDALIQAEQLDAAREVLDIAQNQGLEGTEVGALVARLGKGARAAGQADTQKQLPEKEVQTVQPDEAPAPHEIDTMISLFDQGRHTEAITLAQDMAMRFPRHWAAWKMLGVIFNQQGRSADALIPMQKAAALLPHDAEAHNNLGITLQDLGRPEEAETSYRRALQVNPEYAQAHGNLGSTLQSLGRIGEAEGCYRQAIRLRPDYTKAYCNLGALLQETGRLAEAEASLRQALQINPEYAEAHNNLGATLQATGHPDQAEGCYRQAIRIKPDFTDALNNLALLFDAQGQCASALDTIRRSLAISESAETRSAFVACIKRCTHFTPDDNDLRTTMVRALTEPWARPNELCLASLRLIRLNPDIGECIMRAAHAWPRLLAAHELFGDNGLAASASDLLLCALLDATPICDIGTERFLTMARHALLEAAATGATGNAGLGFYSALARQCFINEYVYAYTDDEICKAARLRDSLAEALQSGADVPTIWPVAVAAYFPLCSLPHANRLLEKEWPKEVVPLLKQQISEPQEEQRLRTTIPRLTRIEGEVSQQVQNQYEENPYPRWVRTVHASRPKNIAAHLRQKFPLAHFECPFNTGNIETLVAGCGTGQHPIGVAQRIRGAHILAIDLSMSSLSYAKRKAQELGLTSIEFAQADLLKLGALGHSFDTIESVGVLHHLADPWAGWRVLLSLLRPGGFMKLGFYSEAARQDVVRIRNMIAEKHYGSTADDIRKFRQHLIGLDDGKSFGTITKSPDFFSISACRDLLFHVQEHRMTLAGINAFLQENRLAFLGFEIDAGILQNYKLQFPDDRTATNLDRWQIFENENPDTFSGMYQFWIQKAG